MKRGKWYLQIVLGLYILSGVLFVAFGGLLMLNGAASSKKYLAAELILFLIPLMAATFLRGKYAVTPREKRHVVLVSLWALFAYYMLALVSMVLLGARGQIRHTINDANFIPLSSILAYVGEWRTGEYVFTWTSVFNNLFGNLVLFAPMAVLLPCILPPLRKLRLLLPFLAELIILVELCQLVTGRGICDVDDFILNFSGAAAAALLMKVPFITRLLEKWHCYTGSSPLPFPKERPEQLPCAA